MSFVREFVFIDEDILKMCDKFAVDAGGALGESIYRGLAINNKQKKITKGLPRSRRVHHVTQG